MIARERWASSSTTGRRTRARRRVRRVLAAAALVGVVGIGAWGLSQRLRPRPMPPYLASLLDSPLTASVVGPEILLDRAGITAGLRVLDAGCGPGRLTLPAARRVGRCGLVIALDSQEAMLDKLRARLAEQGVGNVSTLRRELGTGGLPGGEAFDVVLLTLVSGELRQRQRALAELYGATAPGGRLSVTETLEPDYRRRGTVRREVQRAGFLFECLYGGRISYTMNFLKPLREPKP